MHSTGHAGFGALRAMFLSCRQKWSCSSSTMAVECILQVFAGLHAPRAMFLTFAGRSAVLVVNYGSGMLLLVFAGIFALRAAFPTIAGRCVDVLAVVHVLVYGVMKTVEVPQLLLALSCPVPGQGCCSAFLFFMAGAVSRQGS